MDSAIRSEQRARLDEHLKNWRDRRAGDKIDKLAQPIARAIDKVAGTKLSKCGGCKKMKERLNAAMPLLEALKLRLAGK